MRTLPATVILEKNKLTNDAPFIFLIEIDLVGGTKIYLARNTDDVVYDGNTYTAFPFEIGDEKESSKGEIEFLTLKCGNVSRAMQAYLEDEDGLIGASVILTALHADYLTDVALELTYDVVSSRSDAQWVYLSLGMESPLRKVFPLYRYTLHCNWVRRFKSGAECNYSGPDATCSGTRDDCASKGMLARFGGHWGLKNPNVRVV